MRADSPGFAGRPKPSSDAGNGVVRKAKWDMGRFSQTVSFFKGSPWKLLLPRFLQMGDKKAVRRSPSAQGPEELLIDWGETDGLSVENTWGVLDDVVMGGVSSSSISVEGAGEWNERCLVFSGTTSRENNGGFCSFRSRLFTPPFNMSSYDGLVFKARCKDGLRYKIQLRDNTGWDSPGWSLGFDTVKGGKEVEARIPFSKLIPNFRSQTLKDAEPLNLETISSIQFTLSAFDFDKAMNPAFKEGDFELRLGALRLYSER